MEPNAEMPGAAELNEIAAAVPAAMMAALERRHLNHLDPRIWRQAVLPVGVAGTLLRPLIEIAGPAPAADTVMQRVAAATHRPGFVQVSTFSGDGVRHQVHLGGRRSPGATDGLDQQLAVQASALAAEAPAAVLGRAAALDRGGHTELVRFLDTAPALAVVTGVPGLPLTHGEPGLLDRLVGAMAGSRYLMMIVAEPIPAPDVDTVIDECRALRTAWHGLLRRSVQFQRGTSATRTERELPDQSPWTDPQVLSGLLTFAAAIGLAVATGGATAPVAVAGAAEAAAAARLVMRTKRAQELLKGLHGLGAPLAAAANGRGPGHEITLGTGTSSSWSTSIELLDANAEAVWTQLQATVERFAAARGLAWWSTSLYLAADDEAGLAAMVGTLRSGAAPGAAEPVRVHRPAEHLVRRAMARAAAIELHVAQGDARHPLGPWFDRLATPLNSAELGVLGAFPRREVPGLLARPVVEFARTPPNPERHSVSLGAVLDARGRRLQTVELPADSLNRHVFIAGMSGYGKTTTAMKALVSAWTELQVPFLVIEPAKAEYRKLAEHPKLRDHLRVFGIGDPAVQPLRLNPLEPVPGAPLFRHKDLLRAVFDAAFPMFAGMSYVLDDAITAVYRERGWDLQTSRNEALGPSSSPADRAALLPTIGDLHDVVERELAKREYAPEVHQNMGAALRSRLSSLLGGAKGMALNGAVSVSVSEMFDNPCVIELRNLGDDEEKSFVMALLLCRLFEYAEARTGGAAPAAEHPLRHLTLVEEAHRLLKAPRWGGGAESADAQAKAVRMFTDLLAEMRAYGEGFIVADQTPSGLAPEVIKNSNVKIVHRLAATEDRAMMAGAMGLDDAQSRYLISLRRGVAVVHDDRLVRPVLVDVDRPRDVLDAQDMGGELSTVDQPDSRHLQRNGGCVRCPLPCRFRVSDGRPSAAEPTRLLAAGLVDGLCAAEMDPATEQRAWVRWIAAWSRRAAREELDELARTGGAYCQLTQLAHARLTELADLRCRTAGLDRLSPAHRLLADRAARIVAGVAGAGAAAGVPPEGSRLAAAHGEIQAIVGAEPPIEWSGCDSCAARCVALGRLTALPAATWTTAEARVSMASPAANRADLLLPLVDQVPTPASGASQDFRRRLGHCLATVAAGRRSCGPHGAVPDVDDVIAAIGEGRAD